MKHNITWLLIADASRARIYSLHKACLFQAADHSKKFELIGEYTHQDSRKKSGELTSDKMGTFSSGTVAEASSPKFNAAKQFAHELLTHLEQGRIEKNFRDLIIIAPPNFMGLLHKHMPHEIQKLVSQTIEKDYTQENEHELLQKLLSHL